MPLGKIIKHLRSQGTKGKKSKKEKSALAKTGNAENELDVLKMVREINLDNLGKSNKFESSNGHEPSPSKKSTLDLKLTKSDKRKASDETPVPIPKRRRSSSGHSAFRVPSSASKASSTDTGDDFLKVRAYSFQYIAVESEIPSNSNRKISMQRKLVRSNKSDLLTPRFQKNTTSSAKRKGKGLDWSHNDETNEVGEASDHEVGSLSNYYFLVLSGC